MSTPPNYNYGAFSGGQPAPQALEPERPAAVDRGFWLLIAASAVNVIGAIVTFVALNSEEGRRELALASGASATDVDAAITLGIVLGVGLGLIFVAVGVLFAVFARKGYNWARIVVTVFAALSLLGLIGVDGSLEGILSIIAVLLLIAAVVMLFTAPASAYFNQMKDYRQARKMGYAG